jgi:hypothetical protein
MKTDGTIGNNSHLRQHKSSIQSVFKKLNIPNMPEIFSE